ncbi:MAG: acyl carrier protein [Symploca sp. SIO1B1]|nr:acyl carrier protein [Symploca sp. SIO1B1]
MENQANQTDQMPAVSASNQGNIPGDRQKNPSTAAEIQNWLVSYLTGFLEIDPDEVDPTIPFERYGLDSSTAVALTGDLEDWLGSELDPTLLYDYPTIETLAQHLADESKQFS